MPDFPSLFYHVDPLARRSVACKKPQGTVQFRPDACKVCNPIHSARTTEAQFFMTRSEKGPSPNVSTRVNEQVFAKR